jgi:hypothetical protein
MPPPACRQRAGDQRVHVQPKQRPDRERMIERREREPRIGVVEARVPKDERHEAEGHHGKQSGQEPVRDAVLRPAEQQHRHDRRIQGAEEE